MENKEKDNKVEGKEGQKESSPITEVDSGNGENEKSPEAVAEELLNEFPPEQIEKITRVMSMSVSGPMPNPVADKITSEHISKVLENSDKADKRGFEGFKISKKYNLWYSIIGVAFIVFLTLVLKSFGQETFVQGMIIIGSFAAGFAGGYGIKSYKE